MQLYKNAYFIIILAIIIDVDTLKKQIKVVRSYASCIQPPFNESNLHILHI